jgi:photosystem II stability/assembly factor-like uncharacterized protein
MPRPILSLSSRGCLFASPFALLALAQYAGSAPLKWGEGVSPVSFSASLAESLALAPNAGGIPVRLPGADSCSARLADAGDWVLHCETRYPSAKDARRGWRELCDLVGGYSGGKLDGLGDSRGTDRMFRSAEKGTHARIHLNTRGRLVLLDFGGEPTIPSSGNTHRPISGNQNSRLTSVPPKRQRVRLQTLTYPVGFDPAQARIDAARRLDEMTAAQISAGASTALWIPQGPSPTLSGGGAGAAGNSGASSGQYHWGAWTSSMAVDPSDANTVLIGNPGSGVWKTTDGGATWSAKSDSAPALGIGAIAIAPSSPNVVYAGTGSWWDGVGVLKSTDKGETWQLLPSTFSGLGGPSEFWSAGFIFYAMAVSPADPNVVLAGAWYGTQNRAGIYRSADGGATWKQVFSGGRGSSIVWDPGSPQTVYAAIGEYYWPANNGIYKSVDGGLTWRSSSNGIDSSLFPQSQSTVLTICSSEPTVLYASVPGLNGGTLGVFKTVDGATNWTKIPAPQASRAFLVGVHPQDPNTVIVGDVTLYRSRDGGQTWDNITAGVNGTWTFGDYRAFSFSGDGSQLYIGSDGGVFKTSDARAARVSWAPMNDTLDTVLFYPSSPASIHPTDANFALAGAQDLGILLYAGGRAWTQVHGCDGGTTLIDFVNPVNTYGSCNGISMFKSTQGGAAGSWQLAINGIDTSDVAGFIPPIAMDPHNSQRLFYGTYRLYQSLDGASTWAPISGDVSNGCYDGISSIAVSPADSSFVYLGSRCGSVYVSTNSSAKAPIWSGRRSGLPNRDLTSVVADPTAPPVAYVTFSGFSFGSDKQGHVFKTTNAGVSWNDISGNLPNIPANHLAINHDVDGSDILYLATDVGVFSTSDGGLTWNALSNGLPHAYVEGLLFHHPSRTLRALTLGRGMWDLTVPLPPRRPSPIKHP